MLNATQATLQRSTQINDENFHNSGHVTLELQARKRQLRAVELEASLQQLMSRSSLSRILDTLAELAARNAEELEPIDATLAAQWDAACGKIAVLSNATRV